MPSAKTNRVIGLSGVCEFVIELVLKELGKEIAKRLVSRGMSIIDWTSEAVKQYAYAELVVPEYLDDSTTVRSDTFRAIIHNISQNKDLKSKSNLREISYLHYNTNSSKMEPVRRWMPKNFETQDGIVGEMRRRQTFRSEKRSAETIEKVWTTNDIRLYSYRLSEEELVEEIARWVQEFENEKTRENTLQHFVYSPERRIQLPDRKTSAMSSITRSYLASHWESTKTFQNTFFPEKEEIIKDIDFFQNNKNWYEEKGFPYTLGFLFHGEPGTGKTSTIKAIANYTRRNIVEIKKIKSYSETREIFSSKYLDKKEIPIDKRLFVFEDIDCGGNEEIIMDRKLKKNDKPQKRANKWSVTPPLPDEDEGEAAAEPEITLSDLLGVLDGLLEQPGRMIGKRQ